MASEIEGQRKERKEELTLTMFLVVLCAFCVGFATDSYFWGLAAFFILILVGGRLLEISSRLQDIENALKKQHIP